MNINRFTRIAIFAAILSLTLCFACKKKQPKEADEKQPVPRVTNTPKPEQTKVADLVDEPEETPAEEQKSGREYNIVGKAAGTIRGGIPENLRILVVKKSEGYESKNTKSIKADFDGKFSIAVNEPGEYLVKADLSGMTMSAVQTVVIKDGTENYNVELPIREAMSLKGMLFDAVTSSPLSNILVEVDDGMEAPYQMETDNAGVFNFASIYIFNKAKIQWADQSYFLLENGTIKEHSMPLEFSRNSQNPDLKIALVRQRSFSARIMDRANADSALLKVALVNIDDVKPSADFEYQKEFNIIPEPDGTFSINNLIGKKFRLTVTHPNHFFVFDKEIEYQDADIDKNESIVFPRGSKLKGIVKDQANTPVKNVPVQFAWKNEEGRLQSASFESDENGAFDIIDIPSKTLSYIAVSVPEYIPYYIGPLELPQVEYSVKLTKGITLTGVVYDKNGMPCSSAFEISVLKGMDRNAEDLDFCETMRKEFPAEKGNFSLSVFENGTYHVVAYADDGKEFALSKEIIIQNNSSSEKIKLELKDTQRLHGELKNNDTGTNVSEAKIVLRRWNFQKGKTPSWTEVGEMTTNLSGKFEFNDIVPGYYKFNISHRQLPEKTVIFDFIAEKTEEQLTLFMSNESDSSIKGIVKSAAGVPVSGALVELFPVDPPVLRTELDITDDNGEFRFTGLYPDVKQKIRVSLPGNNAEWKEIAAQDIPELKKGQEHKMEIKLP